MKINEFLHKDAIILQMKAENSDFSISVIPQCGHVIHLEDEERFYLEVNKFLNDKGDAHE